MNDALVSVGLLVCGLVLGYRLPDVDVTPILPLRHRSAWTHGPLLALGAWWLGRTFTGYELFFEGVIIAVAMHLLEDVNPKKWQGSALVNLFPIPFSLPAPLSAVYIGLSIFVSAWVLLQLRAA